MNRVQGNKKGIFTRQRQPKMAAHVIRARYLAMAANSSRVSRQTTTQTESNQKNYSFEQSVGKDMKFDRL